MPTTSGKRFVGASPELLVSVTDDEISCHPLAGTIANEGISDTSTYATWLLGSTKNRTEHRIVVDDIVDRMRRDTPIVLVDMHAEATSEKRALAHHLDGRATVVFGTHTHVPTADERILAGGTAYISDIGMTGPVNSVIGNEVDAVLSRFLTQMPKQLPVAEGPSVLNAVLVQIDGESGLCSCIRRISRQWE